MKKSYPLEFLGKPTNHIRRFPKVKKIEVIFFDSLKNRNKIKRCYITVPYKAGDYDYTTDIINLFLNILKIKVKFVSREKFKKSKNFLYHVYFF